MHVTVILTAIRSRETKIKNKARFYNEGYDKILMIENLSRIQLLFKDHLWTRDVE